jgi:hypothetical protein
MIIGYCGRQRSGKTECAKQLVEKLGFKKLSFADPLRKLIRDVWGLTDKEIAENKNTDFPINVTDEIIDKLSEYAEIPHYYTQEKFEGKVFRNTRDLQQYVGTEYCRNYDPDWHVKRVREMIEEIEYDNNQYVNKEGETVHFVECNYIRADIVFDDVRFPNEKKLIEEMYGACLFIIRDKFDDISNHPSETSIRWQDIPKYHIIINNSSIETLYKKNICLVDQIMNDWYMGAVTDEYTELFDDDVKMYPQKCDKEEYLKYKKGELSDFEYKKEYGALSFVNNKFLVRIQTNNPYLQENLKMLM